MRYDQVTQLLKNAFVSYYRFNSEFYVQSHDICSLLLSMDAVRLQHLNTLLTAGGGSRDEEAEQMVHQVCTCCCVGSLNL